MLNQKLRIAVVGMGKMGLLHASILNALPEVKVVSLVEKSTIMTRILKKVFSPKETIVTSELEKLSEMNLDAVYVTTPISSHSNIIEILFKKKIVKNIFVEKPLAHTYEQSMELRDFAEKLGKITMVGYMKRFSVVFKKAKEVLSQDILGDPCFFKAYAYSSDFQGTNTDSKAYTNRGGALRDIGCHVIDLAFWLLGDLDFCSINSANPEILSDPSISFTVNDSQGLSGQFDISQSKTNYRMPEFGLSIQCQKGKIEVNDDRLILKFEKGNQEKWYKPNLNDNVSFFLGETEYTRENQEFVDSIINERVCEPNFETSTKVDHLIDQVEKELIEDIQ